MKRPRAAGFGAFAVNRRSEVLWRAQLSFGVMWASEWAATVAVSVLAYRDGGAAAIALVAIARMVPAALVAPFAATLADRHRREHVIVGIGMVRTATLAGAATVLVLGGPHAAAYALITVATVAQTLFRPAHSALLPGLCRTPHELTCANVVRGLLDSLATLLGPLSAAALMWLGGVEAALAGCALASLASALLVARLRYEMPLRAPRDGTSARDAIAGLRAIVADPALRLITVLVTVQTFLRGCATLFVVVVAIDLTGGGDAEVGLLNAAIGLGAVAGSLIASALPWNGRLARCMGAGVALWGAPIAVLGGVEGVLLAALLFAVVGVGNALVDIGAFTLIARLGPDRVMGRLFAAFESVLTIGVALGAAATPPAIAALGERGALVALGLVGPVAVIAAWQSLRTLDRRMRTRDADIDALRLVGMLRPLPVPTIEHLASGLERTHFAAGAIVFAEGEAGESFYVITAGCAEIARGSSVVTRLGVGDCFGEIALLRGELPRTATVRAVPDAALEVCVLSSERFVTAVTGFPPSARLADDLVAARLQPR